MAAGRVWTNSFSRSGPCQSMDRLATTRQQRVPAPVRPVTALSLARGATSLYLTGLDGPDMEQLLPIGAAMIGRGGSPLALNTFPLGSEGGGGQPPNPVEQGLFVGRGSTKDMAAGGSGRTRFPILPHPNQWIGWRPLGKQRVPAGFACHRSQSLAPPAPRASTSRVFDGQIWSNFFPSGAAHDWSGWFALGPQHPFPLGSEVAAVSTEPGGTSLFRGRARRRDMAAGRVWTNSFPDPTHPNQWIGWRPLGKQRFSGRVRLFPLLSPRGRGATSPYPHGSRTARYGATSSHRAAMIGRGWFALGPNTFPARVPRWRRSATVPGGTSLFVVGPRWPKFWSTFC